jgi:hypothetical protein
MSVNITHFHGTKISDIQRINPSEIRIWFEVGFGVPPLTIRAESGPLVVLTEVVKKTTVEEKVCGL